jgi:hypothetical protein
MGITQRLGTIPLAISTDASNNVGIGGSPSGSYKLEVTGTGRFSGALTLSSDLTGVNSTFSNTIYAGSSSSTRISIDSDIIKGFFSSESNARFYIGRDAFASGQAGITLGGVTAWAGIGVPNNAGGNGVSLIFAVNSATGTNISASEKMRLTTTGLGIGTSSPISALHVVGTTTINGDDGSLYQRAVTANAAVYWDIRNSVNTRRAYVGFGGNASSLFDIANSEGDTRFIFTGTERMRITSAGNVGIGTSSPASLLHLASSVAGTSVPFFIQNTNASGTGAQITFAPNANFGFGDNAATISSSTSAGGYDVALVFGTYKSAVGPAERMRITSAGNVLVGTTTVAGANSMLEVLAGSAREGLVIKLAAGAYSPIWIRSSTDVAMFYVNEANTGYLNAAAWSYGSDRRIKENIINLEGSGLDTILKLNPVRFDYINGIKNNIGWIAQDVQEVIPEAVDTISKTNDQLTLKSDYIVPYLVKAIQELNERLNKAGL